MSPTETTTLHRAFCDLSPLSWGDYELIARESLTSTTPCQLLYQQEVIGECYLMFQDPDVCYIDLIRIERPYRYHGHGRQIIYGLYEFFSHHLPLQGKLHMRGVAVTLDGELFWKKLNATLSDPIKEPMENWEDEGVIYQIVGYPFDFTLP